MPGKEKQNGAAIDRIIMEHMHGNTRARQTVLYITVQAVYQDISRQAIGRRINQLERDGKIYVIRQIGGEPFYGLVEQTKF
jgi:hypothetical protein